LYGDVMDSWYSNIRRFSEHISNVYCHLHTVVIYFRLKYTSTAIILKMNVGLDESIIEIYLDPRTVT